ncbi:uncharacterized protein N0V89_000680 [Didymosphaeria variabile]|uniref:Opioid growth factor receptor (OGFr) conserved domain-containing protein n=1 Tax=Didymosphaeria variabile TaxID=1932322 RepID=A0A9W8XX27_9PLEO|nr:uncharacterized protein N0V89_000680 [Didymosphaeria variabile]KAJ4360120.1 hypothetical protein N0V89_000680 [Didymosphaeria variabile]
MALRNATGRSGDQPSIIDFYNPHVNGKDAHGRTREQMLKWKHDKLERCHDYIQILFPLPEGSMFSYNAPIIDEETLEAFRSSVVLQTTLSQVFVTILNFYGFEATDGSKRLLGKVTVAKPHMTQAEPEKGKGKATEVEGESDAIPCIVPGQAPSMAITSSLNSTDCTANTEQAEDRKDNARPAASANANDSAAPRSNRKELEALEAFFGGHEFYVIRGPDFAERSKNWCVRMDHNHLRITRILRCLRVLGLQLQCEAFYKALTDVYDDPKINISERSMTFWMRAVCEPLHIAPDGTECKWLRKWQETKQTHV